MNLISWKRYARGIKSTREIVKNLRKLQAENLGKTLKEEIRKPLRLVTLLSTGARNQYKDVFL
jgi:hypothetical protein